MSAVRDERVLVATLCFWRRTDGRRVGEGGCSLGGQDWGGRGAIRGGGCGAVDVDDFETVLSQVQWRRSLHMNEASPVKLSKRVKNQLSEDVLMTRNMVEHLGHSEHKRILHHQVLPARPRVESHNGPSRHLARCTLRIPAPPAGKI